MVLQLQALASLAGMLRRSHNAHRYALSWWSLFQAQTPDTSERRASSCVRLKVVSAGPFLLHARPPYRGLPSFSRFASETAGLVGLCQVAPIGEDGDIIYEASLGQAPEWGQSVWQVLQLKQHSQAILGAPVGTCPN